MKVPQTIWPLTWARNWKHRSNREDRKPTSKNTSYQPLNQMSPQLIIKSSPSLPTRLSSLPLSCMRFFTRSRGWTNTDADILQWAQSTESGWNTSKRLFEQSSLIQSAHLLNLVVFTRAAYSNDPFQVNLLEWSTRRSISYYLFSHMYVLVAWVVRLIVG